MFNKEILLQPKEAEKIFHTSITVDSAEIIYRQPEYGYLSDEWDTTRSFGSMNLSIYGKPCVYLSSRCERSGTFIESTITFDSGSLVSNDSKIEKVANIIYVTRLDTGVTAQFE